MALARAGGWILLRCPISGLFPSWRRRLEEHIHGAGILARFAGIDRLSPKCITTYEAKHIDFRCTVMLDTGSSHIHFQ